MNFGAVGLRVRYLFLHCEFFLLTLGVEGVLLQNQIEYGEDLEIPDRNTDFFKDN